MVLRSATVPVRRRRILARETIMTIADVRITAPETDTDVEAVTEAMTDTTAETASVVTTVTRETGTDETTIIGEMVPIEETIVAEVTAISVAMDPAVPENRA